jgi:hypothetical protein
VQYEGVGVDGWVSDLSELWLLKVRVKKALPNSQKFGSRYETANA